MVHKPSVSGSLKFYCVIFHGNGYTFTRDALFAWTMCLLDLELGFVGGLWVFRWGLVVLSLLQGHNNVCPSGENCPDVIEAFHSASRCQSRLLGASGVCFGTGGSH